MIGKMLLRLIGMCSPNGHWWDNETVVTDTWSRDHPGGPIGNDMLTIESTNRTRRLPPLRSDGSVLQRSAGLTAPPKFHVTDP